MRRRFDERAVRSAERRAREDAAPRLIAAVPNLESLQINVREHRAGNTVADATYVRRVVVLHAPAMFIVPCGEPSCRDDHDLTSSLMPGLRNGATQLEGEDDCRGTVGSSPCQRVLRWTAIAAYRP